MSHCSTSITSEPLHTIGSSIPAAPATFSDYQVLTSSITTSTRSRWTSSSYFPDLATPDPHMLPTIPSFIPSVADMTEWLLLSQTSGFQVSHRPHLPSTYATSPYSTGSAQAKLISSSFPAMTGLVPNAMHSLQSSSCLDVQQLLLPERPVEMRFQEASPVLRIEGDPDQSDTSADHGMADALRPNNASPSSTLPSPPKAVAHPFLILTPTDKQRCEFRSVGRGSSDLRSKLLDMRLAFPPIAEQRTPCAQASTGSRKP